MAYFRASSSQLDGKGKKKPKAKVQCGLIKISLHKPKSKEPELNPASPKGIRNKNGGIQVRPKL